MSGWKNGVGNPDRNPALGHARDLCARGYAQGKLFGKNIDNQNLW